MLKSWEKLPDSLRTDSVRPYYESLKRKQGQLLLKRVFDVLMAALLLVLLSPIMLILALAIKLDSPGTVMFRQVRVTQYGREFRIFKFRTMVSNAQQLGTQVTVKGDARITHPDRRDELCRHKAGGSQVRFSVHSGNDGDAAAACRGDLAGID